MIVDKILSCMDSCVISNQLILSKGEITTKYLIILFHVFVILCHQLNVVVIVVVMSLSLSSSCRPQVVVVKLSLSLSCRCRKVVIVMLLSLSCHCCCSRRQAIIVVIFVVKSLLLTPSRWPQIVVVKS